MGSRLESIDDWFGYRSRAGTFMHRDGSCEVLVVILVSIDAYQTNADTGIYARRYT